MAVPCGMILVPRPGIEPVPSAMEAWSLNHWTAREVPTQGFLKNYFFCLWRGWAHLVLGSKCHHRPPLTVGTKHKRRRCEGTEKCIGAESHPCELPGNGFSWQNFSRPVIDTLVFTGVVSDGAPSICNWRLWKIFKPGSTPCLHLFYPEISQEWIVARRKYLCLEDL